MRIKRVLAVTMALMLLGGIFGTIAGMAVLIGFALVHGSVSGLFGELETLLGISMFFGGGLGAFLGPIAAWLLMRHVPLGLAVGGTLLGTLVGGGIALLATGDPLTVVWSGMAGFGVTAIGLRIGVPRPERRRLGG